jgi:putative MATE family efflux protein
MFAAHQIAMNLESVTLVPVMAFQMATTTLVGQGLGAEKPELSEKVTNQAMLISVAVMTAVAVLFFSFGQYAFYIFTDDPDVISMGSNAMRILAFSLPVTAIYFVLAGALRGAGDTKYAMYVSTIGVWGVRLLVGYLLADVLGLALVGAWTAVVLDMVVRMFFALKRFFSGEWKEVIQAVPEP